MVVGAVRCLFLPPMENQSAAPSAPPSPRATRPVSRLRALILALGAVTFGATCRDQNPTGPGLPVHASVAVAPVYQTATSGGPRLRLARIRARLVEVPAGPDTLAQVSPSTRHLFDAAFIRVLVRRLHAAHEALAHPRRIL